MRHGPQNLIIQLARRPPAPGAHPSANVPVEAAPSVRLGSMNSTTEVATSALPIPSAIPPASFF